MDWRKKQGTGTPWPTWMGYSGIPQNTVLLPVPWQISGTHPLPKLHSSFSSSSHLSKAHSLYHKALGLVKILEHVMFGHSQPRCSRKFPQISTSIFRHYHISKPSSTVVFYHFTKACLVHRTVQTDKTGRSSDLTTTTLYYIILCLN